MVPIFRLFSFNNYSVVFLKMLSKNGKLLYPFAEHLPFNKTNQTLIFLKKLLLRKESFYKNEY